MKNKHYTIKRIIHRSFEEIYSTILISKCTKFSNFKTLLKGKMLVYKINKRGTAESEAEVACLLEKHRIMMSYFEKRYQNFIKNYKFDNIDIPQESKFRNKIWVCWWQGLDNAPMLVKKCIESLCKNAGSNEVIIIDEKNYKKYANIPEIIETKKKEGIISRTHFSDFLRLELLAEHGGVWLDSTFFAKNLKISKILDMPVWSIKRPGYGHLSVSCGDFANYSLGCNFENRRVFAVFRDFLLEYWKNNNIMVDYLFLDYLIELAIKHDEYIGKKFSEIPSNNFQCDELLKVLGEKFDENKWLELLENTDLFKLTWKQNFQTKVNNKYTFYGMLLEGLL